MANPTRWFEYGEPTGNDRVEATIRTTYQTGPNERSREDDVRRGTVSYDALDLLDNDEEIAEHIHDDGSVLLSALSADAEERLLTTFQEREGSSSTPTAEVVKADYREGDEFEFRADVRTEIYNPEGSDVVTIRTYTARPKFDDLVSNEDHVHEFVAYWWPNSYPSQGDSPITDQSHDWKPGADLHDDDALLEQCVESATYDPAAELDSLKDRRGRVRRKLEGGEGR